MERLLFAFMLRQSLCRVHLFEGFASLVLGEGNDLTFKGVADLAIPVCAFGLNAACLHVIKGFHGRNDIPSQVRLRDKQGVGRHDLWWARLARGDDDMDRWPSIPNRGRQL
jgi:hypothetical protein